MGPFSRSLLLMLPSMSCDLRVGVSESDVLAWKRKPFQQAISLLHTFTADINAAEDIRRQGLLILTKRHGKGSAPALTDRPYLAPIRALRLIFRESLGILHRLQKTGSEPKRAGVIPPFFCCHNMKDAPGNE